MGLDMYLEKQTYVKRWEHTPPELQFDVQVNRGGQPCEAIQPERISGVVEEVMYWRKANAIHNWFVQNVQGGIDECQRSHVSREQLQELLAVCKTVKHDPSQVEDMLPPTAGFFFGSTAVDEWYWQDINNTIAVLEKELDGEEDGYGSYYYQASW